MINLYPEIFKLILDIQYRYQSLTEHIVIYLHIAYSSIIILLNLLFGIIYIKGTPIVIYHYAITFSNILSIIFSLSIIDIPLLTLLISLTSIYESRFIFLCLIFTGILLKYPIIYYVILNKIYKIDAYVMKK